MTRLTAVSALVAVWALACLVDNVNTHSDHIQRSFASTIEGFSAESMGAPREWPRDSPPNGEKASIDSIEIHHVHAALSDIRGWLGLWLVAALTGGLPTAVLIRRRV
jgi:hypothetical protein